jgi:hypothetical protein
MVSSTWALVDQALISAPLTGRLRRARELSDRDMAWMEPDAK